MIGIRKTLVLITLITLLLSGVSVAEISYPIHRVSVENVERKFEVWSLYQLFKLNISSDIQLADESIYVNANDVTVPSNASVEKLNSAIEGTGLAGFGNVYIEAESQYGINAIYLLSLTIWESDWGESVLAVNKNNVSGYMAYDHDPYNSAKSYECKSESILDTARLISRGYVREGRTSLRSIGEKYATDTNWANGIEAVSKTLLNRIEKNFGE